MTYTLPPITLTVATFIGKIIVIVNVAFVAKTFCQFFLQRFRIKIINTPQLAEFLTRNLHSIMYTHTHDVACYF